MKLTLSLIVLFILTTSRIESLQRNRPSKPGRKFLEKLTEERSTKYGLYPSVVDASLTAKATASGTCGDLGPEEFCRVTSSKSVSNGEVCDICEGTSGTTSHRHPAEFALDTNSDTWWQSPSLLQGDEFEHINFTITLQDEMEILYLVVKTGPSPRPAAWALELSKEEEGGWTMVKAFARNYQECELLWGVKKNSDKRRKRKPRGGRSKLECFTKFSNIKPIENGEIHVPIGDSTSGMTASRIRLVLRGLHSANSPEQRFYTLRSITIAARCQCYGHADTCSIFNGKTTCSCQHNTCGEHCERCCDGGDWSADKECIPCPCGDRALTCLQTLDGYQCFNCTENRAGDHCDQCLPGFIAVAPGEPCVPCNCDYIGATGECHFSGDSEDIICECRQGFAGINCHKCAEGYAGYPDCLNCMCDPRGSLQPSNSCDDVCLCKKYVTGRLCDACVPGYFGLSEVLDEGCLDCYCSGITNTCSSSPEPPTQVSLDTSSWNASDVTGQYTIVPELDKHGYYTINAEYFMDVSYYWISDVNMKGDCLGSYGSELLFTMGWRLLRGDVDGEPTRGPDFIIIGANNETIAFGDNIYSKGTPKLNILIGLYEIGWYYYGNGSGIDERFALKKEPVPRYRFMDILSNVKRVMLRAYFHRDQIKIWLENIQIRRGDPTFIEHCACLPGYTGHSCQHCAPGFRKLELTSSDDYIYKKFECVPNNCACNGHSNICSDNGECYNCEHNTTGLQCERCLPGYYGNPLESVRVACKPCACPLLVASNNFSPNCALVESHEEEYVCTQCPTGFIGNHCDKCDLGYWGNPEIIGGTCTPCDCEGSPCDIETGECFDCPLHTTGYHCSICQEGYWRNDSISDECLPCNCGKGSLSVSCDFHTGQCICDNFFTGLTCDQCIEGHGDVNAGCPKCNCSIFPTKSAECEEFCHCSGSVLSPVCRRCFIADKGKEQGRCERCNCNTLGSFNSSCDIVTGQCFCKPHVTGVFCDQCETGYWRLSENGCQPCDCGMAGKSCHLLTGECICKPGVMGPLCDTCLPGYYGMSLSGCVECPTCPPGHVCDPVNGLCVCPPHTMGPSCGNCRPGSWRLSPEHGCEACSCSSVGSIGNECDPNGQCQCRRGWSGMRCDQCALGYFGPRCKPCLCDVAGSVPDSCNGTLCDCDGTGQCSCKESVVGLKCDTCRNGSFGLSTWKQSGCTQCYCFGRTSHCTQAGLTKTVIRNTAPRAMKIWNPMDEYDNEYAYERDNYGDSQLQTVDGITLIPGIIGNVTLAKNSIVRVSESPLYWELGERFHGDHITSYGGELRFSTSDQGESPFPPNQLHPFPLVQIRAHTSLILEHYPNENYSSSNHVVRFHENFWKIRKMSKNTLSRISRSGFMIALQDIRRIFVRGTTHALPTYAILHNASMDTAIEIEGRPPPLADGVEMCSCPPAYGSSSCQEAGSGFWVPFKNVSIEEDTDTIVINFHAEAHPCNCNGRSQECDRMTGTCLNCTDNTGGSNCEICAEGFFGSPDRDGCKPCPCPSSSNNNAISCTQLYDGELQCFCKNGYRGKYCEECDVGWRHSQGLCVPCECSSGAIGPQCDSNGQCQCRKETTGLRCEFCVSERHYYDENVCKECDNCTKTLLDDIQKEAEKLNQSIKMLNMTVIPPPEGYLEMIKNRIRTLQYEIDFYQTNASAPNELIESLHMESNNIANSFSHLTKRVNDKLNEATQLLENSRKSAGEASILRKEIRKNIRELDLLSKLDHSLNYKHAMREAKNMLRQIKAIDLSNEAYIAQTVFERAKVQFGIVNATYNKIMRVKNEINNLFQRLDIWHDKMDDIKKLNERVWDIVDIFENSSQNINNRLVIINIKIANIKKEHEKIVNTLLENKSEESLKVIETINKLIKRLPEIIEESKILIDKAEEKEGIMYSLNPVYKTKYIDLAEKHLKNLTDVAASWKRFFSESLSGHENALKAATAYQDIIETIESAKGLTNKSLGTCGEAERMIVYLPSRAQSSLRESLALNKTATQYLEEFKDIESEIDSYRLKVERIGIEIRGIGWKDRELSSICSSLIDHDVSNILSEANNKSTRVFENMRSLYEEADTIAQLVRYQLQPKLQELKTQGDDIIGGAEEHVSQIRSNILKNNILTTSLLEAAYLRKSEDEHVDSTLASAMEMLNTRILRTKHILNSIRVSLSSPIDGRCVRGYKVPETILSPLNDIHIEFSIRSKELRDTVLFYVSNKRESHHMKLEIKEGRVMFSWRIANSHGYVIHPEDLISIGNDDNVEIFYKVHAERIWGVSRLLVKRRRNVFSPDSESHVVTNSSDISKEEMNEFEVRKGDIIWVGGTNGTAYPGLSACIQEISFDGKRLGLWNFDIQPKDAQCVGCTEGFVDVKSSEELSLYHFNGDGYAELVRSDLQPYNRRQFSVSLTFSTFDEDALLFLAMDTVNNRTVSLSLRDCRVVFKVEYGPDWALEIKSEGRHCDGHKIKVQAARAFLKSKQEKGSLRVNGEELFGSPVPPMNSSSFIPILGRRYWMGGLAPGIQIMDPPPPFYGCLGDLRVDQEFLDPFSTTTHFGVENTCSGRPITVAGFFGDGYIEMSPQSLARRSQFGFMFRSEQSDALILFSGPIPTSLTFDESDNEVVPHYELGMNLTLSDQAFLSIALNKGDLEVWLSSGKATLKLISKDFILNDGKFHSVKVVKSGKKIDVVVDSQIAAHGLIVGGGVGIFIKSPLFIGGIPDTLRKNVETRERVAATNGIVGAIKDLVFDGRVMSFDTSTSSKRAQLGRLGPKMGTDATDSPNR